MTADDPATKRDIEQLKRALDDSFLMVFKKLDATDDRTDRIEKKLDALLYQHRVVERVERIEHVLRDKLHVEL